MSLDTIRKHVKELSQVISGDAHVERFEMDASEVRIETEHKLFVITEKEKNRS